MANAEFPDPRRTIILPMRRASSGDPVKDRINRSKHGVALERAQHAFFDPRRVIAEDLDHSGAERRYFCFGLVARATGARKGGFMSSRTVKYTAGEIGRVKVIDDFLPLPDALVGREDNVKVTLGLSRRSVEYFKRAAKARRVPYQRMIRALVDAYAERQRKA
jgi:hypothetical protein